MQNRIVLKELEEIVGKYNGFTQNKMFIEVKLLDKVLFIDNNSTNAHIILEKLKTLRIGDQISILRLDGTFHVRI